MPDLESKISRLTETIFNMLNYANMYVLVLDEKMEVQFANQSLAVDIGYESYEKLVGKCWLDFIPSSEKKIIVTIHKVISDGKEGWRKYREFQNKILTIENNIIHVQWFNSHINSKYNWSLSFGLRKEPETKITMNSIRNYYRDVIDKDKTMIDSMRDMITLRNKVIDTCVY